MLRAIALADAEALVLTSVNTNLLDYSEGNEKREYACPCLLRELLRANTSNYSHSSGAMQDTLYPLAFLTAVAH